MKMRRPLAARCKRLSVAVCGLGVLLSISLMFSLIQHLPAIPEVTHTSHTTPLYRHYNTRFQLAKADIVHPSKENLMVQEIYNISAWLDKHPRLKESAPKLPVCPPGKRMNGDDVVVEKLSQCAAQDFPMLFPPTLEAWRYSKETVCASNLVTFHRDSALLRDVVVDPQHINGSCANVDTVWQDVDTVVPVQGFFKIPTEQCKKLSKYRFRGSSENILTRWVKTTQQIPMLPQSLPLSQRFTIAVKRYEFQNIYHTLSDIYNAFLASSFFGISPSSAEILFIDGKAEGQLFGLWSQLFHSVTRLCEMRAVTGFSALFWNKLGYDSDMLNYSTDDIPLVEDFRTFVLRAFSLDTYVHKPNCSGQLNVVLVSRRDYKNRTITRQIANERAIIGAINSNHSMGLHIHTAHLEDLSVAAQLKLVSHTDILLGMHGAGLSHAFFLQPHAALVELVPSYFHKASGHFQGMARWRKLRYHRWTNTEERYEVRPGVATAVPTQMVARMLWSTRADICNAQ